MTICKSLFLSSVTLVENITNTDFNVMRIGLIMMCTFMYNIFITFLYLLSNLGQLIFIFDTSMICVNYKVEGYIIKKKTKVDIKKCRNI